METRNVCIWNQRRSVPWKSFIVCFILYSRGINNKNCYIHDWMKQKSDSIRWLLSIKSACVFVCACVCVVHRCCKRYIDIFQCDIEEDRLHFLDTNYFPLLDLVASFFYLCTWTHPCHPYSPTPNPKHAFDAFLW